MILVDFSHISHPQCIVSWNNYVENNEDFEIQYRSRVLYTLYEVFKLHKVKNEEVILCLDARNNWRKKEFKHYKANRKTDRDRSGVDWHFCYTVVDKFVQELKENSPFKIVEVDKTEADDVIGILSRHLEGKERIVLISSDKDFKQLHDCYRYTQFNYKGVQVVPEFDAITERQLITLTGDRSDGVPNVFSEDDSLINPDVTAVRFGIKTAEKIIKSDLKTTQKWGTLLEISKTDFYKRNKQMVDLNMVPDPLKQEIIQTYENYKIIGNMELFRKYLYGINDYLADNYTVFNNQKSIKPAWAKYM